MTPRIFKVVIVVAAVVAAVVLAVVAWVRPSAPTSQALDERGKAMEMLGAEIAKRRPDANVLVLSNPFTRDAGPFNEINRFERAGLHGLRRGLGGKGTVTSVFPDLRPEFLANPASVVVPPDCRTPLSFLVRPEAVVELAEAHKEARVIVSLIGLPIGIERLKLWDEKDARTFGLLAPDLRLLGTPEEVAAAFQREKLLAVVVTDGPTGAPRLVTRDNFAEVLQQQPGSLGF